MGTDKSWMNIANKILPQHEKGVNEFFDFAFRQGDVGRVARYPCKKCDNI